MILSIYQINKQALLTVNYQAMGLMLKAACERKAAIPMDMEAIGSRRNADKYEILTCKQNFCNR